MNLDSNLNLQSVYIEKKYKVHSPVTADNKTNLNSIPLQRSSENKDLQEVEFKEFAE